jgi:hypothetical protein
MDPEGVLARLNLGPNMKYPVLGVLRELATVGLLKQHSATDFFRPEPTT